MLYDFKVNSKYMPTNVMVYKLLSIESMALAKFYNINIKAQKAI